MPLAHATIAHLASSVATSGGNLTSILILSPDGTHATGAITFPSSDTKQFIEQIGLKLSPATAETPHFHMGELGDILKTIAQAGAAVLGTLHLSSGDSGIASIVIVGISVISQVLGSLGNPPPTVLEPPPPEFVATPPASKTTFRGGKTVQGPGSTVQRDVPLKKRR